MKISLNFTTPESSKVWYLSQSCCVSDYNVWSLLKFNKWSPDYSIIPGGGISKGMDLGGYVQCTVKQWTWKQLSTYLNVVCYVIWKCVSAWFDARGWLEPMHSLLKFTNNIPTAGYATSDELNHLTGRLHDTIVGPTGRPDPGYVRLVGQTSRTDRSDRL